MTLVYATGQPRFLEFATASSRRQIPVGATVLAVVDARRMEDLLDDPTFEQMTDAEYYELREMINDASRGE
jgi:hypothetical protein